jgi:hypothetical protein
LHRCNSEQTAHLCKLLSIIGNGHIPRQWTQLLHIIHLLKGVPIPKPKSDGLRPIGVSEIILNVANTVLGRALRPTFVEECGGNLAIGVKGGQEAMANAVRAALDADPTLVVANLDLKNFFGSASRRLLIQELCDRVQDGCDTLIPFLRNTLQMCQSGMAIMFRHSLGGGASLIPFRTGFFQGGPLSGPQAAISKKVMNRASRERLVQAIGPADARRVCDLHFADDTNIITPVRLAEPSINSFAYESDKYTQGFNPSKSAIYRPTRDDIDHFALCGIADRIGINKNGLQYADFPAVDQGVVTCGAGIGTECFQKAELQPRLDKAKALVDKIFAVVQESRVSEKRRPVERSLHAAWIIIRLCVPSRLMYFSRVHEPRIFSPFGAQLDVYVYTAIVSLIGIRATDLSLVRGEGPAAEEKRKKILRALFHLPTRMGGLGFTRLASPCADAAFLASKAETANRVRSLVGPFVCEDVPPDAPNTNPLEQPFRTAVVTAAHRSVELLEQQHRDAVTISSNSGIPPETNDGSTPNAPFHDFRRCLETAAGALDNTLDADAAAATSELQEGLSSGIYEAEQIFILGSGIPSMWHLLAFREQSCSIASAWLNAIPDGRLGVFITNLHFIAAILVRLFMHPIPRPAPGAPRALVDCAACATHPTAPIRIPLDEAHISTCRSAGHNSEHNAVQKTIASFLSSHLREAGAGNVITEQFYRSVAGCTEIPDALRRARRNHLYPKCCPTAALPSRAVKGDITIIARPEPAILAYDTALIDVTCSSPPYRLTAAPPRGPAAKTFCARSPPQRFPEEAEAEKIAEFCTSIDTDPDARVSFHPFGISRTGRLAPSAWFVVRRINTLLAKHDATGRSSAKMLSTLIDLISTALQGGMGAKVIRTIQRHQACLSIMLQHQLQPHQQHQSNNLGTGQITASGAAAATAAGAEGPTTSAVTASGSNVAEARAQS